MNLDLVVVCSLTLDRSKASSQQYAHFSRGLRLDARCPALRSVTATETGGNARLLSYIHLMLDGILYACSVMTLS